MIPVAKISPLGVTFHPARHAYVLKRTLAKKTTYGAKEIAAVLLFVLFFQPLY